MCDKVPLRLPSIVIYRLIFSTKRCPRSSYKEYSFFLFSELANPAFENAHSRFGAHYVFVPCYAVLAVAWYGVILVPTCSHPKDCLVIELVHHARLVVLFWISSAIHSKILQRRQETSLLPCNSNWTALCNSQTPGIFAQLVLIWP